MASLHISLLATWPQKRTFVYIPFFWCCQGGAWCTESKCFENHVWRQGIWKLPSNKGAFFGLNCNMDEKMLKTLTTQLVEKGGAFTWVSYLSKFLTRCHLGNFEVDTVVGIFKFFLYIYIYMNTLALLLEELKLLVVACLTCHSVVIFEGWLLLVRARVTCDHLCVCLLLCLYCSWVSLASPQTMIPAKPSYPFRSQSILR